MRRLWNEFKSFAMSGNMLDLALGFIIGAAFAKIIESLAGNVLMQMVAVIFGQPDFTKLTINVNGGEIKYGAFLTDLVNFILLAALLFGVVKFIIFMGVGRGRAFVTKQCPYCQEQVAPNALHLPVLPPAARRRAAAAGRGRGETGRAEPPQGHTHAHPAKAE